MMKIDQISEIEIDIQESLYINRQQPINLINRTAEVYWDTKGFFAFFTETKSMDLLDW